MYISSFANCNCANEISKCNTRPEMLGHFRNSYYPRCDDLKVSIPVHFSKIARVPKFPMFRDAKTPSSKPFPPPPLPLEENRGGQMDRLIEGSPDSLLQLHAAALSSLRSEVAELNSRLLAATRAREATEAALVRAEVQAARAEQRAEQQAARHEERLTELHSVIAELGRQLERHRATVIAEEDESGKREDRFRKSSLLSPPPPFRLRDLWI